MGFLGSLFGPVVSREATRRWATGEKRRAARQRAAARKREEHRRQAVASMDAKLRRDRAREEKARTRRDAAAERQQERRQREEDKIARRQGRPTWFDYGERKRRNPAVNPANLSPADRRALATARRMASEFHGDPGQVVELDRAERKPLPRFVAAAGALDEFTYAPLSGKRAAVKWSHQSGDRGQGKPRSRQKPLLVVDPRSKRPAIVANRSPMRFSSKAGFVG